MTALYYCARFYLQKVYLMTGLKPQLSVSSKHLEVKEGLAQESGNVGSSLGFPLNL